MRHSYESKVEPDKNKWERENVTHYIIFIIQRCAIASCNENVREKVYARLELKSMKKGYPLD